MDIYCYAFLLPTANAARLGFSEGLCSQIVVHAVGVDSESQELRVAPLYILPVTTSVLLGSAGFLTTVWLWIPGVVGEIPNSPLFQSLSRLVHIARKQNASYALPQFEQLYEYLRGATEAEWQALKLEQSLLQPEPEAVPVLLCYCNWQIGKAL